jgi:hypothetical protein
LVPTVPLRADELKRTNRDTTPTREKILERIEDALGMVHKYLEDLKDDSRMNPGVGVGTYMAKAEALIELPEIHDVGLWGDLTLMRRRLPARAALPRRTL